MNEEISKLLIGVIEECEINRSTCLIHSGIGEQQRWIIVRHDGRTVNILVAMFFLEEGQKAFPHLFGC